MENSRSEKAVKKGLCANWTLCHLSLTACKVSEGMQSAGLHAVNFACCQDPGDRSVTPNVLY